MTDADEFKWDVFLSHSSQDKDVVRDIANRLKSDGVRVWFSDWEIRPGDSIPAKIEEGLENSRVLVLCMSKAAFGSDWAQWESHTYRFTQARPDTFEFYIYTLFNFAHGVSNDYREFRYTGRRHLLRHFSNRRR